MADPIFPTLKGDYYSIDPQNYRIVGEKTGKKFTLGDKVKVKLIGTDLDRKTIDFEIIN
jgi:ribonuclease R